MTDEKYLKWNERAAEENAPYKVQRAIEKLLVEFLRGVAVQQVDFQAYKVTHELIDCLLALVNCAQADQYDIIFDSFKCALNDARREHDDRIQDRIASAGCKVIAERISGQATQLSLGESRLFKELMWFFDDRQEILRRLGR